MRQKRLLAIIAKAASEGAPELDLAGESLTELPPEIGQLTALKLLDLEDNQLTALPPEIGQLTALERLKLKGNQLTSLPPEIGRLTALETLNLEDNLLTDLPREIGQLTALETLNLEGNQLTALPPEIGQLTALERFDLEANRLTALPPEIGQLTALERLDLDGNSDLTSPPPEIVRQGTEAILAYLREQLEGTKRQWVSKLLLVGEGGVGKTSLVKALHGDEHDADEPSTHGIRISALALPHPSVDGQAMTLNCWDFGGQQIYHATHQFFLTNRSLFLLVWNARLGWEQGKLHYWLDTIQARAPDSPVLIVSTHIDERAADLPLADLRRLYPQIAGHFAVSNPDRTGTDDLRFAVQGLAADLPLMGVEWPSQWLKAADAVRAQKERYITPDALAETIAEHRVSGENMQILTKSLHELGDILYFQDDKELNDIVILEPQWVSEYIDKVLVSEEIRRNDGIFTRDNMIELWPDLTPWLRDHFLRLLERFDLSYRTLHDREISLVVERLPLDPPAYEANWESAMKSPGAKQIRMKFQLNTLPPGVPTWFIARSHRFTTHTHWRNGALFVKERNGPTIPKHFGLVRAFPHERYIELSVRGPYPPDFFALLKDGLELTLDRFPGLEIKRLIPCPCQGDETCGHEYDYEDLRQRLDWEPPKPLIECPKSVKDVDVRQMLFGLHPGAQDQLLVQMNSLDKNLKHLHAEQMAELSSMKELIQREFLKAHRREQSRIEAICPSVFAMRVRGGGRLKKALSGQEFEFHLYCEAPGCWHHMPDAEPYKIDEPAVWFRTMAPYLRGLVECLKYVMPLAAPVLGVAAADYAKVLDADLKLANAIVKALPQIELAEDELPKARGDEGKGARQASGTHLRALYKFLTDKDPERRWAGLRQVLTPEGHFLWLCSDHAGEYEA